MTGKKIIISGGGTGGHIFPAVAIAQALLKIDANIDILFVGAKGKMEMEKIPQAGYKIKGLWISGLQRKISLQNFLFPVKVINSLLKSFFIIKKFKPSAVVGTGGFASGPLIYMASRMGVPSVIHEQNAYAGLTNKWLSKYVKKICVPFEGMEKFFPKEKLIITGNPVRSELEYSVINKAEAYNFFTIDSSRKTILIIGGSLGAAKINQAVANNLEQLSKYYNIIWQTGKLYIEKYQSLKNNNIFVSDFIYKMDFAYCVSDIVISRAGASSIAELSALGKACILIPSPNVAEDHQTKNAMKLVNENAAILLKDNTANEELVKVTDELMHDEIKISELKNNIKKFHHSHCAEKIAEEILQMIK